MTDKVESDSHMPIIAPAEPWTIMQAPHDEDAKRWHNQSMSSFLSRWLVLSIAAGVMVAVLPGMTPIGTPPVLGVAAFAFFMAIINASIKPVVHVLALPFSILSFGLVALIINWLFMRLASWLALSFFGVGVVIHGFLWSVVGSLIMAIVSSLVGSIIGD